MNNLFIKPEHLKILTDIFQTYCPHAQIWAYGSRVNGDAHEGSDLDLVVRNFNDEDKSVSELKNLISESNIPFLVDVVGYEQLPPSFQKEIERGYIVIYK